MQPIAKSDDNESSRQREKVPATATSKGLQMNFADEGGIVFVKVYFNAKAIWFPHKLGRKLCGLESTVFAESNFRYGFGRSTCSVLPLLSGVREHTVLLETSCFGTLVCQKRLWLQNIRSYCLLGVCCIP